MDLDLIKIDMQAETGETVIRSLGEAMQAKGYVRKTYIEAVLQRESRLPTGLELGDFGVAIPHTDPEHVDEAAVGIAVLQKPVKFRCMIDPEKEISVRLVFLLAIKDPARQVVLLQSMMSVFQDTALLHRLELAKSRQEVADALNHVIQ